MSKVPVEFFPPQIMLIFRLASGVTGEDVPRGVRIARECKNKEWIYHDPMTGNFAQIPPATPDKDYLHLKPTDLPVVWRWLKVEVMREVNAAKLDMLGSFAAALKQEEDYAEILSEFEEEEE